MLFNNRGRLTGGGAGLRNDGFLRFRVGGRALDGELLQSHFKSFPGTGALLRNSDFSDRGAGGKAAVPVRDDGVCLSAS